MSEIYSIHRNYDSTDTEAVSYFGPLPQITGIVTASPDPVDWSRGNYNFLGWNTSSDGSGDMYQPGDTPAAQSVFAIWEEAVVVPDVTISYNGNTIVSLSDSGTEVLETNGTYLTDDITVEYTKQSAASNIVYIDYDYAEDGNTKTYTLKKTGREIEDIFRAGKIVFIKEPNDTYRMMLGWYQESSIIRIYYSNYYTLAGASSISYSHYITTSLNYRPTYQYTSGGGDN